jgi:hypothetical protein
MEKSSATFHSCFVFSTINILLFPLSSYDYPFAGLLIVFCSHRTEENYGSAASDVHKLIIDCCCILCDMHYSIRIILEGMHYEF